MATNNVKEGEAPTQYCTDGYSGSPWEGQPPPNEVPADAPEGTVASNVGITEPTQVFKGDGVTPAEAEAPQVENAEPHGELVEGSVISPAGVTVPTLVFKGDGLTLKSAEPVELEEEEEAEPEAEAASYEEFTVAELKDQAESRGVEVKYDWNKGQIIKALKKADKQEAQ